MAIRSQLVEKAINSNDLRRNLKLTPVHKCVVLKCSLWASNCSVNIGCCDFLSGMEHVGVIVDTLCFHVYLNGGTHPLGSSSDVFFIDMLGHRGQSILGCVAVGITSLIMPGRHCLHHKGP